MASLLEQLKNRRKALGLKQHDMMMRIGMSRQQYQQLESKGNPRLDTLELVANGMKSELMLIPHEKLLTVIALLNEETREMSSPNDSPLDHQSLVDDPWKGLLEGTE